MKPVDYSLLTEKRCSKCNVTKSVSEFNKYSDPSAPLTGWRYYSWCRACSIEQSRRYGTENRPKRNERLRHWRAKNPEAGKARDKKARLYKKYRLTEQQHGEILEAQGARCAMCNREVSLVVDHDHATGKVRGLVCYRCNIGLGWFDAFQSDPKFRRYVSDYMVLANRER